MAQPSMPYNLRNRRDQSYNLRSRVVPAATVDSSDSDDVDTDEDYVDEEEVSESEHESDYETISDSDSDSDSCSDSCSDSEGCLNILLKMPATSAYLSKPGQEFRRIFSRPTDGDLAYFSGRSKVEQFEILKKLKDLVGRADKPLVFTILESNLPDPYKACALQKYIAMKGCQNGDQHKLKSWLSDFMRLPFEKYTDFPVKITDGPEACSRFLIEAKQIMDECVYGLVDVKEQLLQVIGQLIANPKPTGTSIAFKGPMGTGKTTLITKVVSRIFRRPSVFIALGGAEDSSYLTGHQITYEGSKYGKIAEILMECGCNDPIICLDELDKISETPKGQEIVSALMHLIDPTQPGFQDKYFSEINLDIHRAIFFFTFNDESRINPILLDRMKRIGTEGYSIAEKLVIAKQHLIPQICDKYKYPPTDIEIPDEAIKTIITSHTDEQGVRSLARGLDAIFAKENLTRLMDPTLTFPRVIKDVKPYLKQTPEVARSLMYG